MYLFMYVPTPLYIYQQFVCRNKGYGIRDNGQRIRDKGCMGYMGYMYLFTVVLICAIFSGLNNLGYMGYMRCMGYMVFNIWDRGNSCDIYWIYGMRDVKQAKRVQYPSVAKEPPTGTRFKAGRWPAAKASIYENTNILYFIQI